MSEENNQKLEKYEIVVVPSERSGASGNNKTVVKAAEALEGLGKSLKDPASKFRQQLLSEKDAPSEVEVKFGLALEAGLQWGIVSKASATLDVTLKWKRNDNTE